MKRPIKENQKAIDTIVNEIVIAEKKKHSVEIKFDNYFVSFETFNRSEDDPENVVGYLIVMMSKNLTYNNCPYSEYAIIDELGYEFAAKNALDVVLDEVNPTTWEVIN